MWKWDKANLTGDISTVDKDSLEDNLLTIYITFQIPKKGNKLNNMTIQHYIKAVVDISTFEVLSSSESDGAIDGNYTNIF